MQPFGSPRQQRHDDVLNRANKSPRIKDRVYVQFADDLRDKPEDLLKYTDETAAYSNSNTRGHFTANPLINGHDDRIAVPRPHDQAIPPTTTQAISYTQESARTYDFFSPEKRHDNDNERQRYEGSPPRGANPRWKSPQQSQGPLADRIGQDMSPSRGFLDDGFTNDVVHVCQSLLLFQSIVLQADATYSTC